MATPEGHPMDRLQVMHDSFLASPQNYDDAIDRALAQSISYVAIDLSTQVIVRANRPAELLFGYNDGELRGKSINILVPKETQPDHAIWIEQYSKDPTNRPMGARGRRLLGVRKDGTQFPVEIGLTSASIDGIRLGIATILPMVLREREIDKTGETPIVSGSVVRIEATK